MILQRILSFLLILQVSEVISFFRNFLPYRYQQFYKPHWIDQHRMATMNKLRMTSSVTESASISFRFLESNSWEIRTPSFHFLLDPVLETLDFSIPWLYRGNKRYLNGREELNTLIQNHHNGMSHIDFVLISQGLDDHAHSPTLRELQGSIPNLPYIVPPSAVPILLRCGITQQQIITLQPSQSYKLQKKERGEELTIAATTGALVGPPWQAKENGYIVTSSLPHHSSLNRFYYEPHGMFDSNELKAYEGKVPIVISPIVSQELALTANSPSYTLVAGNQQIIDLLKVLKPRYLIPMFNGDLNQDGLLAKFVQSRGSMRDFESQLTAAALPTQLVSNIAPGKEFQVF